MQILAEQISRTIKENEKMLAENIVERIYNLKPDLLNIPVKSDIRKRSLEDVHYHLDYLREAITASDITLFTDYVKWVQVLFDNLGLPQNIWTFTLECMKDILDDNLDETMSKEVNKFIDAGLSLLKQPVAHPAPNIDENTPLSGLANQYLEALLNGDRHAAADLVVDAAEKGTPVKDIYLNVFQQSQYEIGRLWQTNRISVAQEHFCTAATQMIMSRLYPYIFSTEKIGKRLVAACVGGELHEIGVRMVADFFEMEGWDTYYMGANTPTDTIIGSISEKKADVLGLSATIAFNKSTMEDLIRLIRSTDSGKHIKILVGGYPFRQSPDLWKKIGADGFAADAQEAIKVANSMIR